MATTGPITLAGEQTVNGVAVVTGDRVLVKDQANNVDNGIYEANTSAWSRAPDFDGSLDAVDGTLVLVQVAGGAAQLYELDAVNPVIIGTSALVFTQSSLTPSAFGQSLMTAANAAAARDILGSSVVGDAVFIAATAALARTALGSSTVGDAVFIAASAAAARTALGAALNTSLTKAIYGFTYQNNVADATNDIDIAAGGAMDGTGAYWITGAASTKRLDAAWAVGSGNGGLDTGVIGNSDYYIWAIARSDTGVVDYLFSLSSTAPTMPSNYDFKKLIGWFKRVSGVIVSFHTYETEGGGIDFAWDAPTMDVNLANTLTTTRRTDALKVPLNFSVLADIAAAVRDNSAAGEIFIECPDKSDVSPITPNAASVHGHRCGHAIEAVYLG